MNRADTSANANLTGLTGPALFRRFLTRAMLAVLALLIVACSNGGSSDPLPGVVEPIDDDPYPVRILDTSKIEKEVIVENDVGIIVAEAPDYQPTYSGRTRRATTR